MQPSQWEKDEEKSSFLPNMATSRSKEDIRKLQVKATTIEVGRR